MGRNYLFKKLLLFESIIKLIKMFLVVFLIFILIIFFNSIYIVVQNYWNFDYGENFFLEILNFVLVRIVIDYFMFINYFVNFFFYCVIGKKFCKSMDWVFCKF